MDSFILYVGVFAVYAFVPTVPAALNPPLPPVALPLCFVPRKKPVSQVLLLLSPFVVKFASLPAAEYALMYLFSLKKEPCLVCANALPQPPGIPLPPLPGT